MRPRRRHPCDSAASMPRALSSPAAGGADLGAPPAVPGEPTPSSGEAQVLPRPASFPAPRSRIHASGPPLAAEGALRRGAGSAKEGAWRRVPKMASLGYRRHCPLTRLEAPIMTWNRGTSRNAGGVHSLGGTTLELRPREVQYSREPRRTKVL